MRNQILQELQALEELIPALRRSRSRFQGRPKKRKALSYPRLAKALLGALEASGD